MAPFRRNRNILLGLALLVLVPIFAQGQEGSESITMSADHVVSSYEKNNEHSTLTGNARVQTTDLTITAGRIDILGADQRYLVAKTRVTVVDKKRNLVIQGDDFSFDRTTEVVKVRGNAILEDFENNVVVRSTLFEYRMKEDLALINGGVRLYKDDIEATSEAATWLRTSSSLQLQGLPVVQKGTDTYRANSIIINTETDDIQLIGSVEGRVAEKEGQNP